MLDILIICYQEPQEMVDNLLRSIAAQRGMDFSDIRVKIRSDGDREYRFDGEYPFSFSYTKGERIGICAGRNALLDSSDAEYVMFCDGDDMFFSALSLRLILKAAAEGKDAVISNFIEEAMNGWYITHEHDATFVHGKAYRREFLQEHGIRFDERDIRCEDSAFNAKVHAMTKEIVYVDTPVYMWCRNDNSVTRSEDHFEIRNLHRFIDSMDRVILWMRNREVDPGYVVKNVISVANRLMLSDEWLHTDVPEQEKAEKKLEKFTRKYKGYL